MLHDAVEALPTVDAVPGATAEVLWTVSCSWAMLGDLEQALAAVEESHRIEEVLGRYRSGSHFGTQVEAQILRFCGRPHEGVEVLRRGVAENEAVTKRGNPLLAAELRG